MIKNEEIPLRKITDKYIEWEEKGKFVQLTRAWYENGISPTVMAATGGDTMPKVLINNLRIRKLTPRECWRLMGRTDDDFEKAEKACSNSQLYKQAGNSIVVDVLVYLFGELFRQYPIERNENG